MVKLTILYGQPKSVEAFERHYKEVHLPLAAKIEGIARVEMTKIVATPDGSPPPFHRSVELTFDSLAKLQEVMSSPAAQAVNADVPNFATGGVTVFIAQVE